MQIFTAEYQHDRKSRQFPWRDLCRIQILYQIRNSLSLQNLSNILSVHFSEAP